MLELKSFERGHQSLTFMHVYIDFSLSAAA